jgi:hypothetical protein
MTQPIDIISRALKDIGALAAGEAPTPDAAQDCLELLNDMIDQWSNEDMMVFNVAEIIFDVIPGQIQYTIGPSPQSPNFIGATFTGSISGDVLTVTSVQSGAVLQGQQLSGTGITDGTAIVQGLTGGSGNVVEAGTYKINKKYATPVASTSITACYQRPLIIDSAYVRVNTSQSGVPIVNGGIDYPVAVINVQNYNSIGLKTLNGPWPKALYYNPGEIMGNIFLWPNPSQGEMHIFAQTIFSNFTNLYDEIVLPQGYSMALRWCLAERLMPMYGKTDPAILGMISNFAAQAKSTVKRTNMSPMQVSRYQDALLMSRAKDAGWILTGGFTN